MSVIVPEFGGCPWPVDPACLSDQWASMDSLIKARALALASSTLTRLTGGRVGACPIKVRPVPGSGRCFVPTFYGTGFYPGLTETGVWVNNCGVPASLPRCSITLPGPVGRVDQVKVDGALVATYTLLEGRYLVYTGNGVCPWPLHQDITLPDTAAGTMSVTYLNAYPVDSMGANAAALLAMEFALACTGGKCRLPKGVTQIVRQGISMEISTGLFADGITGIREVDAYVALWNPRHLAQAPVVWSPDQPRVSW